MKKTLMTLAAVSALAIGAPATAQYASGNFQARIQQIQSEIQTGVQAGTIRSDDARTLREHLRVLRQTERTYALNGFTRTERQDLQNRIQNLRQQIRYAENVRGDTRYSQSGLVDRNRDGFDDRDFDRDGRWDDDTNTRYGQSGYIDRNRDGFDDRDRDRDGRWDDNSYGMGGPFDEVSQVCGTRSGLGGILGGLLGSDNCLSVGERAPGNLSALPYQYRTQFRDGSGYYHRYVNGNVVQIDARTGTVVRIYDIN
ncbi:MAG TPA: hypothetical protein VGD19_09080 [Allosphingosinicella sp.]|jgi:hypothetical protein